MLNKTALKVEMMRSGHTQKTLAKAIGISERTFYNRLKKADFGISEIEVMMKELKLTDPMPIFFAEQVT